MVMAGGVSMRVIVMMIVPAATALIVRMIMAAIALRVLMSMRLVVTTARGLLMRMIVPTGTMIVVAAAVLMGMIVVIIMIMIMAAAVGGLMADGGQIEDAQNDQRNACDQCHRTENAIRREVMNDSTADVEVKHHTAPKQQERDTDQMIDDTLRAHGFEVARD